MTRDYAVLFLISTLLGYVTHKETTKKIDRLKKQIRKGVNTFATNEPELYDSVGTLANEVWEQTKNNLGADHKNYQVYVHTMVDDLYGLIKDEPAGTKWFSQRTFFDAVESMRTKTGKLEHAEAQSYELKDMFAELLGYRKPTSFATRVKALREGK